jgi:hypothetical protein
MYLTVPQSQGEKTLFCDNYCNILFSYWHIPVPMPLLKKGVSQPCLPSNIFIGGAHRRGGPFFQGDSNTKPAGKKQHNQRTCPEQ